MITPNFIAIVTNFIVCPSCGPFQSVLIAVRVVFKYYILF